MIVTSSGAISGLVISFDTGFFAKSDPPPGLSQTHSPQHEPMTPSDISKNDDGHHDRTSNSKEDETSTNANGVGVDDQGRDRRPRPSPCWFSTGPASAPTHWKQTLLWLRPSERPPLLDEGDAVSGRLALSRNEVNPRELSLRITWTATRQSSGKTYGGSQSYTVC